MLRKLKTNKTQMVPVQDEKDSRHIYELIDERIHSLGEGLEETAAELVLP